jgi:hypothetical protein
MTLSFILFVHVTGVLAMFAGLAMDASGGEPAGNAVQRVSGIGAALTVLSGFYLGARFGVLGAAWLRASYGAIVIMMAAGAFGRRSAALLRVSLAVRTAFGLAIVFLMIAKPAAMVSLVVIGVAAGVATLFALPAPFRHSNGAMLPDPRGHRSAG